ncbi:hypothetical protein P4654_25420 [Niallia taxi]|uniref:hypothetical protein n=1 Tax=Niallia taxi TaxID=2499688 RepID=UPI002E1AC0D5|nr:hypothetical protein [Niallia taxi]MED4118061.1 hypothetical protein [Niallia taxi]
MTAIPTLLPSQSSSSVYFNDINEKKENNKVFFFKDVSLNAFVATSNLFERIVITASENISRVLDKENIKSTVNEVTNTPEDQYYTPSVSIVVNGSLIKGDSYMQGEDKKEFETLISGNLEYIGRINTKPRVDNVDNVIINKRSIDFVEFKNITGNTEFIGRIPKKPRI